MRAMFLEFPGDPAVEMLDRQYMLGDSLLVAPVFSEQGEVTYYLPHGRWTHLLTGETVEGGTWRKETYDFLGLPLFVRENAFVAIGADNTRPDYDYADGVKLGLYALEEGKEAEVTVRSMEGASELEVRAVRSGNRVAFTGTGAGKPFSIQLHSMGEIESVDGSAALAEGAIQVAGGQQTFSFTATLKA